MKTKNFKQLVQDARYNFYGDESLVSYAPKTEGEKIELFTIGKYITDDELEQEYSQRGLTPANPFSLIDFQNDKKYIATHWKDTNNKWCFSTFALWDGEQNVHVNRFVSVWNGRWWFAGVRKSALGTSDTSSSSDTFPFGLSKQDLQDYIAITKTLLAKLEEYVKKI